MKRPLAWLLIATVSVSCATASLETRWQTYQRERAQYERSCSAGSGPHFSPDGTPCHMLYYVQHFHKRWNELIGKVPASETLWAEHERMAREWAQEFLRHHDEGTPLRPASVWVEWARATEERNALDIAQELADLERDAEMRRERALAALYAVGLIAQGVAATATAPSPRVYVYQAPAPPPSKVNLPPPETCTYRLNALRGAMLCVDSRGNVRAR